jgi:ribose/xylose/arabinose/galactoside ABC-type transport system permease subunit
VNLSRLDKYCAAVQLLLTLARCTPTAFPEPHAGQQREMNMARRAGFELTPPSFVVFVLSLVLALLAVLVHYAHLSVPIIDASHAFDVLTIAYVVLTIGVLFRGV